MLLQQLNGSQENGMSLNGAYITFPKRKGMLIMAFVREAFSGARITWHCGILEVAVFRAFSRQFLKISP